MLATLQNQYYRIKLTEKIYATPRMQELTAKVYRLGVEFLYEAVRYYSRSTMRRLLHVVGQPPSLRLADTVTEIKTAIEEMTKEKEMLNGLRLARVEEKVNNVKDVVDSMLDVRN